VHVVTEAASLAHLGEEPRRHPAPEHDREELERVAVRVPDGVAAHAEDQVRLLGRLRVEEDGRRVGRERDLRRLAGRAALDPAEKLLQPLVEAVFDPASDADDHALRAVPGVEVGDERVARGALDRLPRAEDVPAERLIGVEQPVVDVPDVALGRVEVDVHLLENHALLLLDLGLVEARGEEHVGEHVESHVPRFRAAADVVAGQLLAGERVELAADRVDLGRDRPRRRSLLGALEEHVLGEVSDAFRLRRLVPRSRGEHDEARHRAHLREGRGDHSHAVPEGRLPEDRHSRRCYRRRRCPDS